MGERLGLDRDSIVEEIWSEFGDNKGIHEPLHEKTCLTQAGLHSHRRWLEGLYYNALVIFNHAPPPPTAPGNDGDF